MAIEKVRQFLREQGYEEKMHEFDTSSATVELAAQALGCEPERIAKTLSFSVDGRTVLIVTAGDTKIDNSKFKAMFHTKAVMLKYDEVELRVGHAVGGVCPFAVNDGVEIYLDISLKRFSTVFPACGSSNSAVELTPDELYSLSHGAVWADLCKNY